MKKTRIIEYIQKNINGDILRKQYYVEERFLFFFWNRKSYPFLDFNPGRVQTGFKIEYMYMSFDNIEDIEKYSKFQSIKYKGVKIVEALYNRERVFVNTSLTTKSIIGITYFREYHYSMEEAIKYIDDHITINNKNILP